MVPHPHPHTLHTPHTRNQEIHWVTCRPGHTPEPVRQDLIALQSERPDWSIEQAYELERKKCGTIIEAIDVRAKQPHLGTVILGRTQWRDSLAVEVIAVWAPGLGWAVRVLAEHVGRQWGARWICGCSDRKFCRGFGATEYARLFYLEIGESKL